MPLKIAIFQALAYLRGIHPCRLLSGIAGRFPVFLAASLFVFVVVGRAQTITTFAGNGTVGFTGDGGPATAATLNYPWGITADHTGNVYISSGWWGTGSILRNVRRVDAIGNISVFAGNGTPGFSGDGGLATAAQLYGPMGLATDVSGNVFILDHYNYRVRKVNPLGVITTVAGTGTAGYTGDGGPATSAQIYSPYAIATDAAGNVYIGQWYNTCIRKIDTAGYITTIAGTGTIGFSGDGGPATAAQIGEIYGISADAAGNIFFSDWNSHRVRKINAAGIISTVAGNGGSGSSGDGGPATSAQVWAFCIAVDAANNLTISDYENDRIRRVNAVGTISTIGGTGLLGFSGDGGPATAAKLYYPYGLCTDPAGNVYVSDYENVRVRKISNFNRAPYFSAGAFQHLSVCQNSVGDSVNSLLQIVDSDLYQPESWSIAAQGVHGTVNGSCTVISTGGLLMPHGLSYTPATGYAGPDTFRMAVCDGFVFDTISVYVVVNPLPAANSGIGAIARGSYSILGNSTPVGAWSSSNTAVATVASLSGLVYGAALGSATITYTIPTGCMATMPVSVYPFAGTAITTIAGNGAATYSGDGVAATASSLNAPRNAVADRQGNVYIADALNNRIRKVNASGSIVTVAGTGIAGYSGDGAAATAATLNKPYALCLDGAGNIYVADSGNNRVRKINSAGIMTTFAGSGSAVFSGDGLAATVAGLPGPTGLAADVNGNIYVCSGATRVRKINNSGIISTCAGNGSAGYGGDGVSATSTSLNNAISVAVDTAGNVYIADNQNQRIRKVSVSGIITTVAGTGIPGYSGDGSAATAALLHNPWGVCADALGNVCFSDNLSNVIRKVNSSGIISTIAGAGSPGFGGDACAAGAAHFNNVWGISAGNSGNYYIADGNNNRIREIHNNHAPVFVNGRSLTFSVCQNSVDSLNSLLAIADIDNGQGEAWSVLTSPLHGTLAGTTNMTSNGATLIPAGLYYLPSSGYTGSDSFKIVIADCSQGYDTAQIIVTVTPPPSAISGAATVCPGLTTVFTDPAGAGIWSSSNPAIASVGSGTGVVSGVASGVATISFSPGAGCVITRPVTVSAAPAVITGPAYVCLGQSVTLSDASPGGVWSSSNPAVAIIGSTTGGVLGAALGTAILTYLQGGCPSIRSISVNAFPGPVSGFATLCAGSSIVLSDTGTVLWSCGTPGIATIDSFTGLVSGIATGAAAITCTAPGGCYVTGTVIVAPVPSPISGASVICTGNTVAMSDTSLGGVWSISTLGSTASIDSVTGTVYGVNPGIATVLYTFTTGAGCSVTKLITVNPTPLPIGGTDSVCVGSNIVLTDAGGGIWSGSNSSVATVGSNSGIVSGISSGTANIIYSISGCAVSTTITVNPLPAVISGSPLVCTGSTTTLSNSTPGGIWSSSLSVVAAAGSTTGIVSGVAPGISNVIYTLSSGCYRSIAVTVNALPAAILGPSAVCQGQSIIVTDATPGGTWLSTPPTVAGVSPAGTITGINPGSATITYSMPTGCSRSKIVTVNPSPPPFTGPSSVCAGSQIALADSVAGVWSSSSGLVTVGSSTGIVSGLASGTALVTYTAGNGCYLSLPVTVNALPGSIIGPSAVCAGASITLTDSGGGAWGSSLPSLASVGSAGVVTGLVTGTTTISYTLPSGCYVTHVVTVTPAPSPITGASSVCAGSSTLFSDAVAGGTWTSANPAIATVGSLNGTVSGVGAGLSTTISYSLGSGCVVTKLVSVSAAPAAITGTFAVCAGDYTALTDATTGGLWSSSSPAVATVGSTGLVIALLPGTTNITYTAAGCPASATITVNPLPPGIGGPSSVCAGSGITETNAASGGHWSTMSSLLSIGSASGAVSGITAGIAPVSYTLATGCYTTRTVTVLAAPSPISGLSQICAGALTLLSDTTPGGYWTSSGPAAAVSGSSGVVHGISAGTVNISYTLSGCSSVFLLTVNALPSAITAPAGLCSGLIGNFTDSTVGGTWSSSNLTSIPIGSTSGVVTAGPAGSGTISYTLPTGCSTSVSVSVLPAPAPISGPSVLCVGYPVAETGVPGGVWSGSNPAVLVVGSATGLVTGLSTGSATVTYVVSGCPAVKPVTVNLPPAAISGISAICQSAVAHLSDAITGGTWSTSNAAVTTIGATSGNALGVSAGAATITYSTGSGCFVTLPVSVSPAPAVITGAVNICLGGTVALSDASPGGIWSSSNPGIASVSVSGHVLAITGGVDTILYSLPLTGCSALLPLPVISVPAIAGPDSICAWGDTMLVSDAYPGGTGIYTSSSISVYNLGGGVGRLTSASPGVASVSYTVPGGCSVTKMVTVNPVPGMISGSNNLCVGNTTILTDGPAGGSWSSAIPAVASVVPSSGLVTGNSTGMTNVTYALSTGCKSVTTINVAHPPATIQGGVSVCTGASVVCTDSVGGGTWSSSNPAIFSVGATTGLVSGVSAGIASLTYTMAPSCFLSRPMTVNPLPGLFSVTGGGSYCAGGAGMPVGLSGSETGIIYQMFYGDSSYGAAVAGTGAGLNFGLQSLTGSYSAMATNVATHCSVPMTDTVTIGTIPVVVPGVSLLSAEGDTVCMGNALHLTAAGVNAGATPVYSWMVNGVVSGTGVYFSYVPSNNDLVRVLLTSSAVCAEPDTVSATQQMTVDSLLQPVVSVLADPGTVIYPGQQVTFTASALHAGLAPAYSWSINGVAVPGATDAVFTSSGLNSGDQVSCVVTSSGSCGGLQGSAQVIMMVDNVKVPLMLSQPAITVAPNPNVGIFLLSGRFTANNDGSVYVGVFDMFGRIIYQTNIITKNGLLNESIMVSGIIPDGLYLLKLQSAIEEREIPIVICEKK